VTDSPLDTLPTTRRAILNLLKRQGPLAVHDVAQALGLTPAAVRMQLVRLEEDGLLARADATGAESGDDETTSGESTSGESTSGESTSAESTSAESTGRGARRGRPAHTYQLTSAAETLYPKRYGDLTTELLGYLGGPDGEQVDELFELRRRRRVDGALPRLSHLSFDEQVAALAAILDEDGYLADATRQTDGSWLITEHNCAILTVAHGFSQACSSELSFIRDALPGATVERVAHLMDGAHVCAYRITPATT
jgi:DeoR family transcriptional regulator, suf operon transcriptional repressor